MAVPRNRHSNKRTRLKRIHQRIEIVQFVSCKNCGRDKRSHHHLCLQCGFYKGERILER